MCRPSAVETTPVEYPTGHSNVGSPFRPPALERPDPKNPAAPTTIRQLAAIVNHRLQPLPRSGEIGIQAAQIMNVPPISTTSRIERMCICEGQRTLSVRVASPSTNTAERQPHLGKPHLGNPHGPIRCRWLGLHLFLRELELPAPLFRALKGRARFDQYREYLRGCDQCVHLAPEQLRSPAGAACNSLISRLTPSTSPLSAGQ